tara:strand:+ start:86 stop:658 length:573 start_codon:yes stop_codon:yes gene_type:complete
MPWKHNHKIIQPGKVWRSSDGTLHSARWASKSDTWKAKWGLVWEDPPASEAPYNSRFYYGRQSDGTLIPKSLTDVNVVDKDGKAVNDPKTGKQMITLGLKSVWVAETKRTANKKLAVYDWYVTRKVEKETAIPSSVTTYRDAVRTKCAEIETALNGAADLASFMALFEDVRNSDGSLKTIAKINDWPDEI